MKSQLLPDLFVGKERGDEGTLRIDIDDGMAEPGIVAAIGPLAACECELSTVGTSICSWDAGCICGTVPVGVTDKAGVEEEMKDGGGSIGVLFPVSTTGTGDIPGNDC